jgi:hypothetical protein
MDSVENREDKTSKRLYTFIRQMENVTARDYLKFMQILNRKDVYSAEVYEILTPIIEWRSISYGMATPKVNIATKGGGGWGVISSATYINTPRGDKIEIVAIGNNLNASEGAYLQLMMERLTNDAGLFNLYSNDLTESIKSFNLYIESPATVREDE